MISLSSIIQNENRVRGIQFENSRCFTKYFSFMSTKNHSLCGRWTPVSIKFDKVYEIVLFFDVKILSHFFES